MIDFLSNLETYRQVDEYYVITAEQMTITIRVVESLAGAQDFAFKAYPYFPVLDAPSSLQYQGVGSTPEEALQVCLKAINGVPLAEIMTNIEN